jgi:hypothetical protein
MELGFGFFFKFWGVIPIPNFGQPLISVPICKTPTCSMQKKIELLFQGDNIYYKG